MKLPVSSLSMPHDVNRLPALLQQRLSETNQQVNQLSEGLITAVHSARTAVPTTGRWNRGDFIRYTEPSEDTDVPLNYALLGWLCVAAGEPGTWVEARVITADQTAWLDIDFPIVARTAVANNPTPATVSGNITAPQWAVNDWSMCEGRELIHGWVEGSEVFYHIHLITNGSDGTNRYVKFEVEYLFAKNGSVLSGDTITSGELEIPASTTSLTHKIFSIGSFTPSTSTIGTHVYSRLKRIAASGTAPTSDPWVTMLQLHIQVNSIGSRSIQTK